MVKARGLWEEPAVPENEMPRNFNPSHYAQMQTYKQNLSQESFRGLYERVQICKTKLKEILAEDEVREQVEGSPNCKILVVSHGGLMKTMTASGIIGDSKLENYQEFQNCEAYPAKF